MLVSENTAAFIVIATNETGSTELWCIIFNTSEIKTYRHITNLLVGGDNSCRDQEVGMSSHGTEVHRRQKLVQIYRIKIPKTI
jgi:hypothetical protein